MDFCEGGQGSAALKEQKSLDISVGKTDLVHCKPPLVVPQGRSVNQGCGFEVPPIHALINQGGNARMQNSAFVPNDAVAIAWDNRLNITAHRGFPPISLRQEKGGVGSHGARRDLYEFPSLHLDRYYQDRSRGASRVCWFI